MCSDLRRLSARDLLGAAFPVALVIIAVLAVYWQGLGNPLVFDSTVWFDEPRLRILEAYGYTDRYLSKKLAYWLWTWSSGDIPLLRSINTGLHALTAVVGYLFFRRLFTAVLGAGGSDTAGMRPEALAMAGALIFALHPVLVYAAGYLGQMEIILAMLFGLLFLTLFLNGLLRRDAVRLYAAGLLYWIALLCKENVIMIPAVALAMTFLVRPLSLRLVRELWLPFILYGLIALHVFTLSDVGVGQVYEPSVEAALKRAEDLGLGVSVQNAHGLSIVTQAYFFFRYWIFWLFPFPGWMSIDLQFPVATYLLEWPYMAGVLGFCLYPLLTGWLLLKGGRLGLLGFCLMFPWLMFFTEFVAVRLQESFVLYRSYLWIIGPSWAVPLLLAKLRVFPVIFVVIIVSLGAISSERLSTFKSPYLLWEDAVEKNEPYEELALGTHRAYLNRGNALANLGRSSEAMEDYDKALELNPGLGQAHVNRAAILVQSQQFEAALEAVNQAIMHKDSLSPTALAAAYNNRGGIYLFLEQFDRAVRDFEEAVRLAPEHEQFNRNLRRTRELIRKGLAP